VKYFEHFWIEKKINEKIGDADILGTYSGGGGMVRRAILEPVSNQSGCGATSSRPTFKLYRLSASQSQFKTTSAAAFTAVNGF
jgi:hypothetical protein